MEIFLGVLFVLVCILLVGIILLQKGRGGGLGAALGGAGAGGAFGTRTGDVLTWVTIILTGLYLLMGIGAVFVFRPDAGLVEPPAALPEKEAIVASPNPTPPPNTFILKDRIVRVRLETQVPGASVRYTLDGSTPTENSPPAPARPDALNIPAGTTLKARGFRRDWEPSRVATWRFLRQLETPKVRRIGAVGTGPVKVALSHPARDAEIYYSLDGTEPKKDDPGIKLYADEPVAVLPGQTIMARAYAMNSWPSEAESWTYPEPEAAKAAAAPEISPAGGEIAEAVKVTINTSTPEAKIRYTVDRSEPTAESTLYEGELTVEPGTVVKARAFAEGFAPSPVGSAEFKKKP